jgi:alpha-L-rhamnosidase
MSNPTTEGTRPALADLRVEYEAAPNNVSPGSEPRFSWRIGPGRRGAGQTAYRVVVARDRDTLFEEGGTVWDSGRVKSDRSVAVPYDGTPLRADTTYYWRVRVWDGDGAPSRWSEPAVFETALGGDHEWDGEWIAHQPGPGDTNGYRSAWHPAHADVEEWVQVDLGSSRRISTVELFPTSPFDGPETPDGMILSPLFSEADDDGHPITARGADGFGFPVRYRVEVADEPTFADSTVVVDRTGEDQPNPGDKSRQFDVEATGRHARVVATDLYRVGPESGGPAYHSTNAELVREERRAWRAFALAALRVRDADGRDLARDRPVTASSSVETDTWGCAKLVDDADRSETAATSPQLRTEVDLDGPVERARLHVATLGWGEAYINGDRVGEAVFDPAWTDYDSRVLYSTHDVTDHLREGANALGLWLGRGWFARNDYAWTGFGSPRARFHLTVEYADGSTRTVGSGGGWQSTASPVVENDVYDGETYDAREETDGWTCPDFDGDWSDAVVVDGPGGEMRPQRVQPVREVRTFDPVEITERDGAYLIDFGQNLTGYLDLTVRGADRGRGIELAHAEAIGDEGDLSTPASGTPGYRTTRGSWTRQT